MSGELATHVANLQRENDRLKSELEQAEQKWDSVDMAGLPDRVQAVLLAAHRATLSYQQDPDSWDALVQACEHITDAEICDLTNAAFKKSENRPEQNANPPKPALKPNQQEERHADEETDRIAHALDVGCEYCGARTGLERHTVPRSRRVKFRCVDADACNARELANSQEDLA